MRPWRQNRRHRPALHWRQLEVFTAQVRDQAAAAGFPAVTVPGRRIDAGADTWVAFFETADWTALEHAQTALVRVRGKEFPA